VISPLTLREMRRVLHAKKLPADSSLPTLPDLDTLARETKCVIRESTRMDPSTFLDTLSGAEASGFGSLNQIAIGLSQRTGLPISNFQGWNFGAGSEWR